MATKRKGVNGKQKGASFERKMVKEFTEWTSWKFQRTLLSGGGEEKADICCVDRRTPWLIELKNRESFKEWQLIQYKPTSPVWQWWSKLKTEQKHMGGKPIMLICKRNGITPLVTVECGLAQEFLKWEGLTFHATLAIPGEVVHTFLWDEVRKHVEMTLR